jgi:hypothetical protein
MERRFSLLEGCVLVSMEQGQAPGDIVEVLLEAASLARQEGRDGLLIVSGVGDPATAPALCDAILAISRVGAPPPSRIAFIAYQFPQYDSYHFAAAFAPNHGFEAKLFVSLNEAKAWAMRRPG